MHLMIYTRRAKQHRTLGFSVSQKFAQCVDVLVLVLSTASNHLQRPARQPAAVRCESLRIDDLLHYSINADCVACE